MTAMTLPSSFTSMGRLGSAGAGSLPHWMIEGENLRALSDLSELLAGSVDLIYLDPPYNTGDTGRSYLDSFGSNVEWKGFLAPRLRAALPLLTRTGAVVISVGDAGLAPLRGLADEIFGARNYLTTLIQQGGVRNSARFTGAGVDYMLVYGRDRLAMRRADVRWREQKPGVEEILRAGASAWSRSGHRADVATGHLRAWWRSREHAFARGLHEYCRVDASGRVFRIGYLGAPHGTGGGRYDVMDPVRRRVVASPPADWVVSEHRMKQLIAEDRVEFHDDRDRVPSRKLFLDEMTTQAPLPTFEQRRDAGTLRLRQILGEHRFDHPKDPQVLARWFRMMAGPDAFILDFFAGSGTTSDAVMLLNHQDGGSRRSVLITTNEVAPRDVASLTADGAARGDDRWEARGVFRNVLRPRIETLVSGIRPNGSMFSTGLLEQVEFFRMTEG